MSPPAGSPRAGMVGMGHQKPQMWVIPLQDYRLGLRGTLDSLLHTYVRLHTARAHSNTRRCRYTHYFTHTLLRVYSCSRTPSYARGQQAGPTEQPRCLRPTGHFRPARLWEFLHSCPCPGSPGSAPQPVLPTLGYPGVWPEAQCLPGPLYLPISLPLIPVMGLNLSPTPEYTHHRDAHAHIHT